MGRHRPRGACLGRGLVRRPGLGSVRPDSRSRDVRRHVLVRLGLEGRGGGASPGRSERRDAVRRPRAPGPRRPGSGRRRPPPSADPRSSRWLSAWAPSGRLWSGSARRSSGAPAHLTRDSRRAATASRRELEAFLRDQGIAIPVSATLDDLRLAVWGELGLDSRSFVEAAAQARFGPPVGTDVAARVPLGASCAELLRRVRGQLSLWARFGDSSLCARSAAAGSS